MHVAMQSGTHKLLLAYQVSPEDFLHLTYDTPEMGWATVPKQPMLNDLKLLRKVYNFHIHKNGRFLSALFS